ncbi:MAG: hypothetical protein ACKO6N_22580 [Myxococcota bacterium]
MDALKTAPGSGSRWGMQIPGGMWMSRRRDALRQQGFYVPGARGLLVMTLSTLLGLSVLLWVHFERVPRLIHARGAQWVRIAGWLEQGHHARTGEYVGCGFELPVCETVLPWIVWPRRMPGYRLGVRLEGEGYRAIAETGAGRWELRSGGEAVWIGNPGTALKEEAGGR